ncbi:MAG: 4-alpha-glucanotransferase, partial [Candidatus Omnitrophica bacterium]|nr:4-alpha-glucanotransferase [Candidatus Omnitrophota bacterium]
MSKVYFLFGVHNHQPTGNFSHIFEQAYQRCYFPFISLLEKFPKVKFSLHNSGCLYDWIKEFKKEYMQILKKLVKRGQAEVVSGGYYEPILPLISDEDKIGQIHMMNEFIRKEFNSKPRGIWTTERVWEPYLARIINACGLKYTFLDDTHFRFAGLQEEEFF